MRTLSIGFSGMAGGPFSHSDASSCSGRQPPELGKREQHPTSACGIGLPGSWVRPAHYWVALRLLLFLGVATGLGCRPASAAQQPSERAPYSDSAIRLAQTPRGPSSRPLRLRSGTFLPAGALESNLARARTGARGERRVHAILQLGEAQGPAVRTNLAELGVRLLGYLPEQAFFASIPREIGADKLKRAGVAWVGAVYPADKLSPRMVTSGVGHWAIRADGSADLWIKYYGDVLPGHAMRELAKFKTRVLELN